MFGPIIKLVLLLLDDDGGRGGGGRGGGKGIGKERFRPVTGELWLSIPEVADDAEIGIAE